MPAEHLGLPGFSITACDMRGQIEEPPLMRFRISLQHIPAAPYCPELPFSGRSRFGVLRCGHPRLRSLCPCGFWRLASSNSCV